MRGNHDSMFEDLLAFKAKYRHCNVPTNSTENPPLGRWVAAQRYKRRIGVLPQELVEALDAIGFVWSPADKAWDAMFKDLTAFRAKHGHADVPEQWSDNRRLANWVQSQRHRHRKGRLSPGRAKRLDDIGFTWAIYKSDDEAPAVATEAEVPLPTIEEPASEKIYVIRNGLYVQYNGVGEMPRALGQYIEAQGEFPPHMPLPEKATVFLMGESLLRQRKYEWPGSGPLPQAVMDYVRVNGMLPRHEVK